MTAPDGTKLGVGPRRAKVLSDRLAALGVLERDLRERFVRARGPGGQNVNKVSTAVVLRHIPTGVEVRAETERSQALNRYRARVRLAEILEERRDGRESERRKAIERIRRQKRRRSRRAKAKMVAQKRVHGALKETRRKPGIESE